MLTQQKNKIQLLGAKFLSPVTCSQLASQAASQVVLGSYQLAIQQSLTYLLSTWHPYIPIIISIKLVDNQGNSACICSLDQHAQAYFCFFPGNKTVYGSGNRCIALPRRFVIFLLSENYCYSQIATPSDRTSQLASKLLNRR